MSEDLCPFQDSDLQDFNSKDVNDMLAKIKRLFPENDPILHYFAVDAMLSKTFRIVLFSLSQKWNQHVANAEHMQELIWEGDTWKDVPEVWKQAAWGMRLLDYLLYQGEENQVCKYGDDACNFVIGIMESNMCLCIAYAFYVQALSNQFGKNLIQICVQPGHAVNIVRFENTVISFDAGYRKNISVLIEYDDPLVNRDQVFSYLNIHVNNFDRFTLMSSKPDICNDLSFVKKRDVDAYMLMHEACRKKNYETTLRNIALITYLYPDATIINEMLHVLWLEYKMSQSCDKNETVAVKRQIEYDLLYNCIQNKPNHKKLYSEFDVTTSPIVAAFRVLYSYYATDMFAESMLTQIWFHRTKELILASGAPHMQVKTQEDRSILFLFGKKTVVTIKFQVLHRSEKDWYIPEQSVILYNPNFLRWSNQFPSSQFFLDPQDTLEKDEMLTYHIGPSSQSVNIKRFRLKKEDTPLVYERRALPLPHI